MKIPHEPAWLKDRNPPEVLVGSRPVKLVPPLSTNAPPSPFLQNPASSRPVTTLMVKWSEIPATLMSSRFTPAMPNAVSAATLAAGNSVRLSTAFGSMWLWPSP